MDWISYEDVARELLHRFRKDLGLSAVQGKQSIRGRATSWEIDAKGVREADGATIVVECRRYTTSRDNQRNAAGLAYTIIDTGSAGGIHVSPLGLQEGAARIAACENIIEVHLNKNATPEQFQMSFLDQLKLGFADEARLNVHETLRILQRDREGNIVSDEDTDPQGQ
jgi:hypothetical protein